MATTEPKFRAGQIVYNGWGRRVRLVRLGNGMLGFRHVIKCRHDGCKHRKSGYLTPSWGGGMFCDKAGNSLADLRNQHFDCGRHD